MGYDKEKGWIPSTFNEILEEYVKEMNKNLSPTEAYTVDNIKGTNLWKVFLASMEYDKESQNLIPLILSTWQEEINSLQEGFFYSQAGLISGIKQSLINIDGVENVCITNQDVQNGEVVLPNLAGKIMIGVLYSQGKENDPLLDTVISNAICDNIGAGIISVNTELEDQTPNKKENIQGVLSATGQMFMHNWAVTEKIELFLKIEYKRTLGVAMPSEKEIKDMLLDKLKEYSYGEAFNPNTYSRCGFDFFREMNLFYSFDKGSSWQNKEYYFPYYQLPIFSSENIQIVLVG